MWSSHHVRRPSGTICRAASTHKPSARDSTMDPAPLSVDLADGMQSPIREDIDLGVTPLTPSPVQRVEPRIAPSAVFFQGHQVVPGIGVTMSAKEAKRLRRSEIEKRSRERRQGSVSIMREELDRLERQYNLLMAKDENASCGAIAHPSEVADLRARFLQLSSEASALREEDKTLREMLHEKQLFSDSMRSLLTQFSDDQHLSWSAVAHANSKPISIEQCFEYMRGAYDQITRFENDRNFVTTGSSILGWTDKRRLVKAENTMYFAFTKQFDTYHDPEQLMTDSWEMFCDEQAMRRTIFGGGVHVKLQTLQVVSDDILIMHRHTRYAAMQRSFHTVYLLFRVRTERGYTIVFRTIPCPSIQNSLEDGESWIELFHWMHHVNVGSGDSPEAVETSFGGSIGGSVIKFAMHWMIELIMTVIRWENVCVAPLFIKASVT